MTGDVDSDAHLLKNLPTPDVFHLPSLLKNIYNTEIKQIHSKNKTFNTNNNFEIK